MSIFLFIYGCSLVTSTAVDFQKGKGNEPLSAVFANPMCGVGFGWKFLFSLCLLSLTW